MMTRSSSEIRKRKSLSFSFAECLFELLQKLFLGFGHEHTRADRDRHVRINFGIIQRGVEGNFKIIPHQFWDSLGTRYETRSVMHYGSYAGSFFKTF